MDTQTEIVSVPLTARAVPAAPKPPAVYGLDVPYDGTPIRVVAGPGLDAAVQHLKGAGATGFTAAQLADRMGIMQASAENYTRKLALLGLLSRTPLQGHTGKGVTPLVFAWIPGREIALFSQEDEWTRTALESVKARTKKRQANAALRQANQRIKLEFAKTQQSTIKALKDQANATVKAARIAAKAEMDAKVKALIAEAQGKVPAPLPALDLVSQPGSVSAMAVEQPAPAPVAAPKKGVLPPKGKKA